MSVQAALRAPAVHAAVLAIIVPINFASAGDTVAKWQAATGSATSRGQWTSPREAEDPRWNFHQVPQGTDRAELRSTCGELKTR
jgi:cation transporter-like permease